MVKALVEVLKNEIKWPSEEEWQELLQKFREWRKELKHLMKVRAAPAVGTTRILFQNTPSRI
jgi:hypothetical protein